MGSYGETKIAVIQFNEENLIPGTKSWESTSHSVRRALEKNGCFLAVTEKIPSELREALFKFTMPLFDLPAETKESLEAEFLGSGYGGNYKVMPLKEHFGISDGSNVQVVKNFARLMWPGTGGNDHFCETTVSYFKYVCELEEKIVRMVFTSYGVEKYYDAHMQSLFYLTKFIKYRAPKENECNTGFIPHIDKAFIGIIATTTKGLEIESRDGEWLNFEPSPNAFLVMAGEPFAAWSNGRIYAPVHAVVIRGEEAKYSLGQFLFLNGTVEVPTELVDDENPLKFKPFNHLEFLQYCCDGGKTTVKNAIEAYCGI